MTRSDKNAARSSDSCATTPTLSEILRLDAERRETDDFASAPASNADARAPNVAALKRIKESLDRDSRKETRQDVDFEENARVEYPYYDGEIALTSERVAVSPPPAPREVSPAKENEKAAFLSPERKAPTLAERRDNPKRENSFKETVKIVVENARRSTPASESAATSKSVASQIQFQSPRADKSKDAIFRYCVELINSRASASLQKTNANAASEASARQNEFGVVRALERNGDGRAPMVLNESTFLGFVTPTVGADNE